MRRRIYLEKFNYSTLMILILSFCTGIFACRYDTGWRTYTQPNGVKFTARMWGDEYEVFFETREGYSIDKNSADNYYYYAAGSNKGIFILTKLKVGINNPAGLPKYLSTKNPYLSRSQKTENKDSISNNNLNKTTLVYYTLKVLLVEFSDIHGRDYYTRANFENMLDGSSYTMSPDGSRYF